MGTSLSPDTVKHLLHYEGDTVLGRDGGHYFNRLVHLIKAADEAEREWIAERHAEVVAGVEMLMRAPWAFDWLRGVAKKHEAGIEVATDEWTATFDLALLPHPPVPASAHVAFGRGRR